MPPLINVRSISKAFRGRSTVSERLLHGFRGRSHWTHRSEWFGQIHASSNSRGHGIADDGEIAVPKRIRMSYVEQESAFRPSDTVRSVIEAALKSSAVPESERGTLFAEKLGRDT